MSGHMASIFAVQLCHWGFPFSSSDPVLSVDPCVNAPEKGVSIDERCCDNTPLFESVQFRELAQASEIIPDVQLLYGRHGFVAHSGLQ